MSCKEALAMADDEEDVRLLPATDLSPSLRSFLDHHFQSLDDLSGSPALASRLSSELHSSELALSRLHSRILEKLATWASYSHSLSSSLTAISRRIEDFTVDGEPSVDNDPANTRIQEATKYDLVGQLPILAGEVARVERVRLYAETALRLEALVGDLEDAVASIVMSTPTGRSPRKLASSPAPDVLAGSSKKLSMAMNTLREIENVVVQTMRSWPQWKRLFSAVDIRVDGTVTSLRHSAIADYRLKLTVIGWPPPLSAANVQEGQGVKEFENPLLGMHGDNRDRFEESFVALSTLQAVQCRRRSRQLTEVSQKGEANSRFDKNFRVGQFFDHEILWTVDELVAPIQSRVEYHFLKWSEKPELIFALAYRIAQQYIKSVDVILQPMLDRVRMAGYCVREEWVSAMVTVVVKHLQSHVLPKLAQNIIEEARGQEVTSLWLHIVDLAMAFDKRMRSLALQSVGPVTMNLDVDSLQESELDLHPLVKCVSVFAERRDWLELWAQLELLDAQEKLSMELQKERSWLPVNRSDSSLGAPNLDSSLAYEDCKAPRSAEIAMLKMWALINRCHTLPQPDLRVVFIRYVGAPFVKGYLEDLLQRCQEAEALTALVDEGAVVKVAMCINAAYYCEQKLWEWSENIYFLDLRVTQILSTSQTSDNSELRDFKIAKGENLSSVQGSIFDEEITCLIEFRTEWLQKLVSAIQRGFDASCVEYQRNKKKWQDENSVMTLHLSNSDKLDLMMPKPLHGGASMDMSVSSSLVDALAALQGRLKILKEMLGDVVFTDLWRSLASGLDLFFFNTVVLGGARFSLYGSYQLARDIEALFQVFKPFCVRPASFFPFLSDAVILLTLPQGEVVSLLKNMASSSTWRFREQVEDSRSTRFKECGVKWINPGTAGKVLSHRILPKV